MSADEVEGVPDPAPDPDGTADGPAAGSAAGWLEDDPRVKAGVEHLQRAAHEVIEASRALLDVAEELIESPGGVSRLFGVLGELGDVAGRLARSAGAAAPGAAGSGSDDDPGADPPVQRIPVS